MKVISWASAWSPTLPKRNKKSQKRLLTGKCMVGKIVNVKGTVTTNIVVTGQQAICVSEYLSEYILICQSV
jgi:hypothetical protein